MLRLILRAASQNPWVCYSLLAIYIPLVIFPHEWVQRMLGEWLVKPLGQGGFYRFMAGLGFLGIIAGGAFLWRGVRRHPWRSTILRYAALTLILVLLAWRLLSVNNSELVHFVQYAVPGFLLLALTGSVTHTLAWITLIGGLDEGYQYAGLHPTWGIPFDFNDVYLDLLGGVIGVLLAMVHMQPLSARVNWWIATRPGVILLAAIAGGTGLLVLLGKVVLYQDNTKHYWFALSRLKLPGFWFFDETWGPRTIHTLTPIEGPILILLTLFLYSRLDRRQ